MGIELLLSCAGFDDHELYCSDAKSPFSALTSLNNGQANTIITASILAAVASACTERWKYSAAFLTLPVIFKVYPIALGTLIATLLPFKFAGRLLAAVTISFVLSFFLQDPAYVAQQYLDWIQRLSEIDRSAWPLTAAFRDFWLLSRVWHLPISRATYCVIQLVTALLVVVVCLASRKSGASTRRVLNEALSCSLMVASDE